MRWPRRRARASLSPVCSCGSTWAMPGRASSTRPSAAAAAAGRAGRARSFGGCPPVRPAAPARLPGASAASGGGRPADVRHRRHAGAGRRAHEHRCHPDREHGHARARSGAAPHPGGPPGEQRSATRRRHGAVSRLAWRPSPRSRRHFRSRPRRATRSSSVGLNARVCPANAPSTSSRSSGPARCRASVAGESGDRGPGARPAG